MNKIKVPPIRGKEIEAYVKAHSGWLDATCPGPTAKERWAYEQGYRQGIALGWAERGKQEEG